MTLVQSEALTPETALATYGKSFNWARRFLGRRMGTNAAMLYRFCRVLDDMADGDIKNGPERLLVIHQDLCANGAVLASDKLLASFQPFITAHKLPLPVINALIEGLLDDQKPVRINDQAELLRYCYRVAGTVGLMMCNLLDCDDKDAMAHAIDLGIAMQLTNIARDVLEDAQMQRRYLPASWAWKISPDKIFGLSQSPENAAGKQVTAAVKTMLALADDYYKSGLAGCAYLPLRAHLAISVAAITYRQIGVQIAGTGYAWYLGRQSTGLLTKILCSFIALGSLTSRFRPLSPHKSSLHTALKGLPYVR